MNRFYSAMLMMASAVFDVAAATEELEPRPFIEGPKLLDPSSGEVIATLSMQESAKYQMRDPDGDIAAIVKSTHLTKVELHGDRKFAKGDTIAWWAYSHG